MEQDLPWVAVFIPTFNDRVDLEACLQSLRKIDYPKGLIEIIVWDNASTDDTVAMVERQYSAMAGDGWAGLRLIKGERNEGSYLPYNLILPVLSSRFDHILGLDADVELCEGALRYMIAASRPKDVGVVGARSVYYDKPSITAHGAGFVNLWTGFYSEKDEVSAVECDYVIGCCWLLNRSALEEAGGFDADYYINHWEVDYCLRLKKLGYRICYEPRAVALHKISPTVTNLSRLPYLYRNKIKVIRKTFPPLHRVSALTCALTLGLVKAVYDSIRRHSGFYREELFMIVRSYWEGVRGQSGRIEGDRLLK